MAALKKVFAVIVLILMGGWLTVSGVREFRESRQLVDHGKVTLGMAIEKSKYRRKLSTTYNVTAEYQTGEGKLRSRSFAVSETDYDRVSDVDPRIKVTYLPENPEIASAGEKVSTKFGNIIWGLLLVSGAVLLIVKFKQPLDEKEAAIEVAGAIKHLSIGKHQYAPANARKFTHLDLKWLDASQQKLEGLGFRFMEDIEDLTVSAGSGPKTFLRCHLGRDETVMAALYHLKLGFLIRAIGGKEAKVLDFETEFSNGNWVCPGNAEAAGAFEQPVKIDTLQMPAGTPIELVVQAHDGRVAKFLAANTGVRPLPVSTSEDMLRAQDRLTEIKAAFRREHGISKKELQKMAGTSGAALEKIHAEANRIHQHDRAKAA